MVNSGYENVHFHRMLINDSVRCEAYRKAIFEAVKPGDVVVDAGSGLGVLTFFACQAGASKVYAIEKTNIIHVAAQLAKQNNFDDRIVFLQEDAMDVNLPEQVDVIVSELISKAVYGQLMEPIIARLRDDFLKNNGRMVPEKVSLHMAPVNCPAVVETIISPKHEVYDINFSALNEFARNHYYSHRFEADNIVTAAQQVNDIDLFTTQGAEIINTDVEFKIEKSTIIHGFTGWFSSQLSAGVLLSNKPPGNLSWNNAFFPLQEFVQVDGEETIKVNVKVKEAGAQTIWQWNTKIFSIDGSVRNEYSQNSFAGKVLSLKIAKNNPD